MPLSLSISLLDPSSILVDRPNRQRSVVSTDGLKDSIARRGVLHPIIVRRDLTLVAGERRLECCRELGIQVPVRFFDDLSPVEHSIVELEENLKRSDLSWQDMVRSTAKVHDLYKSLEPGWTIEKTAEQIGLAAPTLSEILTVHGQLGDTRVASAGSWYSAYNFICRVNQRQADKVMANFMEEAGEAFRHIQPEASVPASVPEPTPATADSVLCANFLEWAPAYSGPKFNFIHCDFPFGANAFRRGGFIGPKSSPLVEYSDRPEDNDELLECLLANLDRLLTPSAHVMFWFSMKRYEFTRQALSTKLIVNAFPLVWLKSDNAGVTPDPRHDPRQIFETAFYCYRGDRPLVSVKGNAYPAPTDNRLHPSAKPEPMLRHFFGMLVDNTTRMLDPTAGSGSALRAAESFGAEYVLGLETELEHVETANAEIRKERVKRKLAG